MRNAEWMPGRRRARKARRMLHALIALRHADASFAVSSPEFLTGPDGLLAYRAGDLLVAANLTAGPIEPPAAAGKVLLSTSGRAGRPEVLPPWQGIIARWQA